VADQNLGVEQNLRLENVRKVRNVGLLAETEEPHDIDLRLDHSEFLALIGASGSGKGMLLNHASQRRDQASAWPCHRRRVSISPADLRVHREGNVMMPMLADRGFPEAEIEQRAGAVRAGQSRPNSSFGCPPSLAP
jgi:lipoprotein-releasing system ATP-binding protein